MKNKENDNFLHDLHLPNTEGIKHQNELKIPLLSYKKSSKAGLWLLTLPGIAAIAIILKYELRIISPVSEFIYKLLGVIDDNEFLTYLIPIIFAGFPLLAMIINLLAFCHFAYAEKKKELLITVKYKPINISIFLFSFALLFYFFLPDRLSF